MNGTDNMSNAQLLAEFKRAAIKVLQDRADNDEGISGLVAGLENRAK